ncbi:MAG TPA: hypothetical protein VFR23_10955 [Jiangellaceae bacterium]|nr:hypothetical protein [Jiangellaceae bacterium]
MNSVPKPRPALRRSDDGTVHLIGRPASSLAVDAVTDRIRKKDKMDEVQLVVTLSKRVRKQLRRKAEQYGWTAEEAAAHVLRAWADS